MAALRDSFQLGMTLQAPTEYWQKKQFGHRVAATMWAMTFLVVAFCSSLGLAEIWKLTLLPYFSMSSSSHFDVFARFAAAPLPYGAYVPIVGAAFLAVWILRIVSRQLLTQFALSSDAGDRVAMVKTFLALMQRPDHVKEDDRILILSALFRPATRSDEDGAPPNWFDLLMTRVNPKG